MIRSFELKPDFSTTYKRIEAFWHNDVTDRPVTMCPIPKPANEQTERPHSDHISSADRWMDVDFQAEDANIRIQNQIYIGDTLPIAFPNLGPEVFSSFYGCPIHFGDYGTSWTEPIIERWEQADELHLDLNSPILNVLDRMTDALLDAGKNRFLVGMTDWHPGGDALAALREPQLLAIDLIEHKDSVLQLLERLEEDYFFIYNRFYEKLRQHNQPITSWTPLVYDGKYYIPSNDFSIMVSKTMFDEIFLPGIQRECQFLDRSIYHLDGPGALRHLDSLLGIPELQAIQWVPGAGNEQFLRWVPVYQHIQAAGKGIQVNCKFKEVNDVMTHLEPKGLFLYIDGVPDQDSGEALLKQMERWTKEKERSF